MYFSGSGHLHTRFGHFRFYEKLGGRFRRPSRLGVQQEEEEEDEAMVCGWRKMAVDAMSARE